MLERINIQKEELIEICKNPVKFANYIIGLPASEYTLLFEILNHDQTIQFLHNGSILSKILRSLPEENRMMLISAINYEIMRELIQTREHLGEIFKSLPPNDYFQLSNGLGDQYIFNIIKDKPSLGYVMRMLQKEKHIFFINAIGVDIVISMLHCEKSSKRDLHLLHLKSENDFIATVFKISAASLFNATHGISTIHNRKHTTMFSSINDKDAWNDAEKYEANISLVLR